MSNILVKLKDGQNVVLPEGASGIDLVNKLDENLPREAVAIKIGEHIKDLTTIFTDNQEDVEIITLNSPDGLEVLRHTTAHIMAQAVRRIFPGTKIAIGPTIQDGFYYDFDPITTFTAEDIEKIEEEMQKIIKEDYPIRREELPRRDAIALFSQLGEPYKVELLEELPGDVVSIYRQGEFLDLCRGPHLPSTGRARVFKLLKIAGAYWRGDETKKMLQRIYGTAFPERKHLEEYLKRLQEAARRDHRKLGPQLELYQMFEEAGPGLIFYLPKGALLRSIIEDFLKQEHLKRGYQLLHTPHIMRGKLWRTSGHYENYRENMYFVPLEGEEEYVLKPMNCPGHILIYKHKIRSYRDLPIKFFELGTVYRKERSGVLLGLLRVRGFTQDDAHIFCHPEALEKEIREVFSFALDMLSTFGFKDYKILLSTRPLEGFIGEVANWDKAEKALASALEKEAVDYHVDKGAGAFYGPKIDITIKDVLGREWQGPTIQLDFNLAERFDLTFVDSDGEHKRPVMIHRALLGSLERFLGCLVEQYGGDFPLWLAPVQVLLIPVAERHQPFCRELQKKFTLEGIRVELDERRENIGYKIREAELQKIPYMIVIGDKEVSTNKLSLRSRKIGNEGEWQVEEFVRRIKEESEKKI